METGGKSVPLVYSSAVSDDAQRTDSGRGTVLSPAYAVWPGRSQQYAGPLPRLCSRDTVDIQNWPVGTVRLSDRYGMGICA